MPVALVLQQFALLREHLDHVWIRIEHLLAREQRRRGHEPAVVVDWIVDRQTVPLPHGEIVLTMRGRGVHGARAALEGDVFAERHRNLALEKRVAERQALERGPADTPELALAADACPREHRVGELGCDDDEFLARAASDLEQ